MDAEKHLLRIILTVYPPATQQKSSPAKGAATACEGLFTARAAALETTDTGMLARTIAGGAALGRWNNRTKQGFPWGCHSATAHQGERVKGKGDLKLCSSALAGRASSHKSKRAAEWRPFCDLI
jgi:hypothetical protein